MNAKSMSIALLALLIASFIVLRPVPARADAPSTAPADAPAMPAVGMDISPPTPSTQPGSMQPSANPGSADANVDDIKLADRYTNPLYGISFQPPMDTIKIDKPTPDVIVEFTNEPAKLELRVWRDALPNPVPLNSVDQAGKHQDGVVDLAIDNIRRDWPSAKILRNEIINVGRLNVGMIAVRYDSPDPATPRKLTQKAIVEVPNSNHELYYLLDLTVPGAPANQPDGQIDPVEMNAAKVFSKMVDSVALLDLSQIVAEQRERLYNTRLLFVNWMSGRGVMVKSALIPEQWQRALKNGKDVGYSYIVEDLIENSKTPNDQSIRIGVRSRYIPSEKLEFDYNWTLNSSLDRKHENWSTTGKETNEKGETLYSYSQAGSSDEATKSVLLERPNVSQTGTINTPVDTGPLGQGNIDIKTVRTLTVDTTERKARLQAFQQDTPVYFVPQAFSNLLPRLLPLNEPKKYMFATFVSSAQSGMITQGAGLVMARYLDVSPIQSVDFNGQNYPAAVAISDRIGLDGEITTYYMTPQGKFIGSMAKRLEGGQTVTTLIIPTDRETLLHLWGHPDLTRPEAPAADGPAADAPATNAPMTGEIAR